MIKIKNLDFICKRNLIFTDLTYNYEFNKMYNIHRHYYLKKYLITKTDYFMRYGHNISYKSEMSFTFIINANKTTYEYYLEEPKSMLEWILIEKLARNPNLINAIDRTLSHPLIREYCDVDPVGSQIL